MRMVLQVELTESIDSFKTAIHAKKNELTELEGTISTISHPDNLSSAISRKVSLEAEIKGLENRLEALEGEQTAQRKQLAIKAAQERVEALNSDLKGLVEKYNNQLEELQKTLKEIEQLRPELQRNRAIMNGDYYAEIYSRNFDPKEIDFKPLKIFGETTPNFLIYQG